MAEMYCGVGNVPKNKARGSAEYCAQNKQIRYYGLVKVDKNLVNTKKGPDLIKEQLKYKKIEDDAKILIRDARTAKLIIDNPTARKSEKTAATKRHKALLEKRDKIVKRLNDQKKVVDQLEKEKAKADRAVKKKSRK